MVGFPLPTIGVWLPKGLLGTFFPPWMMVSKQPDADENVLKIIHLPASGLDGWGSIYPAVYKDLIYFIYGDSTKEVIRFNITASQDRKIKNSHRHNNREMGSMLSSHVMLFGSTYIDKGMSWFAHDMVFQKTDLWSLEKEQWIQGPDLPVQLLNEGVCVVTVNQATTLYIQKSSAFQAVMSFNMVTKSWTLEQVFVAVKDINIRSCLLHTTKQFQRIILMVGFQTIYLSDSSTQLYSYDLDLKTWKQLVNVAEDMPMERLISISGAVYSLWLHSNENNVTSITFHQLDLDLMNNSYNCSINFSKPLFNDTFYEPCSLQQHKRCQAHLNFATFLFNYRFFQAN